jgi:hypothetical protein
VRRNLFIVILRENVPRILRANGILWRRPLKMTAMRAVIEDEHGNLRYVSQSIQALSSQAGETGCQAASSIICGAVLSQAGVLFL